MQIGRVSDKPEDKLFNYGSGVYKKPRKPVEAVTFDRIEISGDSSEADCTFLRQFIEAMPEEVVRERMKDYLDAFVELEEILCEKLIMEEL